MQAGDPPQKNHVVVMRRALSLAVMLGICLSSAPPLFDLVVSVWPLPSPSQAPPD